MVREVDHLFAAQCIAAVQQASIVAAAQYLAEAAANGANRYTIKTGRYDLSTTSAIAARASKSGGGESTQRRADFLTKVSPDW
jgi:hypothetical protein